MSVALAVALVPGQEGAARVGASCRAAVADIARDACAVPHAVSHAVPHAAILAAFLAAVAVAATDAALAAGDAVAGCSGDSVAARPAAAASLPG